MFGYRRKPGTSTGESLLKYKPPRPGFPGAKDTSRLDEIFKEAYEMGKNRVVDTEGNIHERIRVVVETECKEDFATYTWNTMSEINQMLNSNKDFISIGDIVVRCKSIVSVYKIEEKPKENES